MKEKEAREETARRLGFSPQSVVNIIKEMLSEGNVQDNKVNLNCRNSFDKLEEEEISDLRKLIHGEMQKCNVKRMDEENQELRYPTITSLHKIVLESGKYPNWSLMTFRKHYWAWISN